MQWTISDQIHNLYALLSPMRPLWSTAAFQGCPREVRSDHVCGLLLSGA
jgi:hypothetical protein